MVLAILKWTFHAQETLRKRFILPLRIFQFFETHNFYVFFNFIFPYPEPAPRIWVFSVFSVNWLCLRLKPPGMENVQFSLAMTAFRWGMKSFLSLYWKYSRIPQNTKRKKFPRHITFARIRTVYIPDEPQPITGSFVFVVLLLQHPTNKPIRTV